MENGANAILLPEIYSDVLSITQGDTDFGRFKNKTVVITGAGQLLGYYIACALLVGNDIYSSGTKIVAVDRDDSIFQLYGKLTYRGDIDFAVSADYSYMMCDKADYVIHTAELDGTCDAVLNLLDFITQTKARAVLNSSSAIYGDVFNGKGEIGEYDCGYVDCARTSGNTQEMRMAETLAKKLADEGKADISLTRCCRLLGGMSLKDNYSKMLGDVAHGRNAAVDREKDLPESLCYVTDAAAAILRVLLDGESGEIYNISSGINASLSTVAEECTKIYPKIKTVYKGREKALSPMFHTFCILNNDKLKSLGFAPLVDLSDGIKRAVSVMTALRERG